MSPRFISAAALLLVSACNCGPSTDPSADGGTAAWGEPCAADEECGAGLCLSTGRCSKACTATGDCPATLDWRCIEISERQKACACTADLGPEICDGLDNDCDGVADVGATCDAGKSCVDGVCRCDPGDECGGTCVDFSSDDVNCGGCGLTCASNELCAEASCRCAVPLCRGECIDHTSDPRHCGACDAPCDVAESCVSGTCTCADDALACGDRCIDSLRDPENCGQCGLSCGVAESCVNGLCECAAPSVLCDGTCRDVGRDGAHCGECGLACVAGFECGAGTCVPVDREWARWSFGVLPQWTGDPVGDTRTGLVWERSPPVIAVPLAEAQGRCDALVSGGFDDWRLPTRIELLSIVDFSRHQPAIDVTAFPATQPGPYWTSTADATNPARAWSVIFRDGYAAPSPATGAFHVRCVR